MAPSNSLPGAVLLLLLSVDNIENISLLILILLVQLLLDIRTYVHFFHVSNISVIVPETTSRRSPCPCIPTTMTTPLSWTWKKKKKKTTNIIKVSLPSHPTLTAECKVAVAVKTVNLYIIDSFALM